MHQLFVEFDDIELLFPANIELVQKFVMNFHEFFLEDSNFFLVLAAVRPLVRLRKAHIIISVK